MAYMRSEVFVPNLSKPICLACAEVEVVKTQPGYTDGPAPERQLEGITSERCCMCDSPTAAGIYKRLLPW